MINTIIHGDCLDQMQLIEKESVDLIYLDPPFFTEKVHTLTNKDKKKRYAFHDVWGSSQKYIEFIGERLEIMFSLLKSTGSIFVHCDKSGEHLIRLVLDEVFGPKNFQSEIIWTYKRWSNSKKGLLPNHQNIYFYSKSKDFKFNRFYTQYSESTNIDQILQRRTRNEHNVTVYDSDELGNVKTGGKKKGVPLSDVWDIPYLNPKARERVGYPTQKPILLLDQIIRLVTEENDLVLDPFCGSGTTCVSSKLLNRNFIGIDQSIDAVNLSNERLANPVKTESNLLKKGRDSYVNANINSLGLLRGIDFNPVQRNKGIDAILVEQHNGTPILVRVQRENETVEEAAHYLAKAMKKKNSSCSVLIQTSLSSFIIETTINIPGLKIIQAPALQISNLIT